MTIGLSNHVAFLLEEATVSDRVIGDRSVPADPPSGPLVAPRARVVTDGGDRNVEETSF
jgi:hypothetical protein